MDIKCLSDEKRGIIGVFAPVEDWERLQRQYNTSKKAPADSGAKQQESLGKTLQKVKPSDLAE